MATVNIEQFLARIAHDEKGMKIMEALLTATIAQREAEKRFREYFGQVPKSEESVGVLKTFREDPPRTSEQSLAQRAVKLVMDSEKAVTTEYLAGALNATVMQVRGALKRFVRKGSITKPHKGLWQRADVGRQNGKRDSTTNVTAS